MREDTLFDYQRYPRYLIAKRVALYHLYRLKCNGVNIHKQSILTDPQIVDYLILDLLQLSLVIYAEVRM